MTCMTGEEEVQFEIDGGRYGNAGCDLCSDKTSPCISIPAAEDQSSTGACEKCVRRMLAAFTKANE